MKKIILSILMLNLLFLSLGFSEKQVAITFDDLPFRGFKKNLQPAKQIENNLKLLLLLNKLDIPTTIFVNEEDLQSDKNFTKKMKLYDQWIKNPLITVGNHTFSHPNLANVSLEEFKTNILLGEKITRKLLKKYNKSLKFFRFPYNGTGMDLETRDNIFNFLTHKRYIVTPFTIESSDYIFNTIFTLFLKKGQIQKADKIAQSYVDFTLQLFSHFEIYSQKNFQRNISHIFLGHGNLLHVHCLDRLIKELKNRGYSFINLDTAMKDKVYQKTNYYDKKYGVSWIYRWIKKSAERIKLMRKEPELDPEIFKLYQQIIKEG